MQELPSLKFTDVTVTVNIAVSGSITASADIGQVRIQTEDFGQTVPSDTDRNVSVAIIVPSQYANAGKRIYGTVTATQPALAAPGNVTISPATNIKSTKATLTGRYDSSAAGLTETGFYYAINTGGSTSVTTHTNKFVVNKLYDRSANISSGPPYWTDPFNGVAGSDVALIDKDGNTIPSANYTYEDPASTHPSRFTLDKSTYTVAQANALLPITVVQVSTATTTTNGYSQSELVTNGTKVSFTSNFTSPFTTNLTGLTANTQHAAIAFATNSAGTTYSSVEIFTTDVANPRAWPSNEFLIAPTISPEITTDYITNRNIGYGEFADKNSNGRVQFGVVKPGSNLVFGAGGEDKTISVDSGNPESITVNYVVNVGHSAYYFNIPSSNGEYEVTFSATGFNDKTFTYYKGSGSYTTTFTINTTGIHIASADNGTGSNYQYNLSRTGPPLITTYTGIMGPVGPGDKVDMIIPLNSTSASFTYDNNAEPFKSTFVADNLSVSIDGKSEGYDYDWYIEETSSAINSLPGIIIRGTPSFIGTTATLNITYTT